METRCRRCVAGAALALMAVLATGSACADNRGWHEVNEAAKTAHAEGRIEESQALFTRALELAEDGDDPTQLIMSLNNLGELHRGAGRLPTAVPLYERALELQGRQIGVDSPSMAKGYVNLATAYERTGDLAEARRRYAQALEIREKTLGPDHPDLATIMNNLGTLALLEDDLDTAEGFFGRSIEILDARALTGDSRLSLTYTNLAGVHRARGDYAAAEVLLRKAVRGWELAGAVIRTATARNNLAQVLRLLERHDEAEKLHLEALSALQEKLGAHPDVAATMNGLALLYRHQGQYGEAETYYQSAIEMLESLNAPPAQELAVGLFNLGRLYEEQQRFDEAEAAYRRSLQLYESSLGPDHTRVALVLERIATLLQNTQRGEEARALSDRARTIRGDG